MTALFYQWSNSNTKPSQIKLNAKTTNGVSRKVTNKGAAKSCYYSHHWNTRRNFTWSYTLALGTRSIYYWVYVFSCSSCWSPDILRVSSFQLLIKTRKFTAMITLHFHLQPQYKYELFYIIYSSHHFTAREDMNSINWPRSHVWLPSSAGRASHRYCGGHGFDSRWGPDIFRASSFQLLQFENLLRWSLFTFKKNI